MKSSIPETFLKTGLDKIDSDKVERVPLTEFLERVFKKNPFFIEIVKKAIEVAEERKEFLYFAGGVVRDFFTGFPTHDLDLVLEGNLSEFLKELLKRVRGKIVFKSQFLTYKVKFFKNGEELEVDFITARKEYYPAPASLPVVSPSNFVDDILRRDFTINAMIYGLTPPYKGTLIDLFQGRKHLEKGVLKPLKRDSFVEDPTRVFRGIRYKVRFNLNYHEIFYQALELAFSKKVFPLLSPQRIANEIQGYLKKEPPQNLKSLIQETFLNLKVFRDFNYLPSEDFLSRLSFFWEKKREFFLSYLKEKGQTKKIFRAFLFSFIFFKEGPFKEAWFIFPPFFTEDEKKALERDLIKVLKKLIEKKETFLADSSEFLLFLEKVSPLYVPLIFVNFPEFSEKIIWFIENFKFFKPSLSGRDLKEMGIGEGRKIGEILSLLKKKRIQGEIKTEEEERRFVKNLVLDKKEV